MLVACGCGCGGSVESPDKKGRTRRFVRGHSSRVVPTNVMRTCPNCHKEFTKTKRGQDYCSFDCHYPRKICVCGCGKELPEEGRKCSDTKYIPGHHWLGKKHTEEQIRKIGLASVGSNNPNWQGGIAPSKYTTHFLKRQRFQICDEFKNTCPVCGNVCVKYGGHVHHIDYDKKNNDNKNLILLCKFCHGKTIPKNTRTHWQIVLSRLRTEKEMAL